MGLARRDATLRLFPGCKARLFHGAIIAPLCTISEGNDTQIDAVSTEMLWSRGRPWEQQLLCAWSDPMM